MRYSTHSCLVLLLALAVATLCSGFQSSSSPLLVSSLSQRTTTNPIAGQSQPQTTRTCVLKMSEDEEAVEEGEAQQAKEPVVCPDCDLCDGSGRIAGGIGALVPWIPIKAYRPCPNFVDRGGNYQRAGQPLDEIAFGKKNVDKWG